MKRLVIAVLVGVIVWLVCLVLGTVLLQVNVGWVSALGALLKDLSPLIGVVAGAYNYLTGRPSF